MAKRKRKRRKNPKAEVDELVLYIDNTGPGTTYPPMAAGIYPARERYIKMMIRGGVTGQQATNALRNLAHKGAKAYSQAFGSGPYKWQEIFTDSDIDSAANDLASIWRDEIRDRRNENPKRRKKVARKKKRSAAQIAATKKLVAWGKKHRGRKKRKTTVRKKRRNPVRKTRKTSVRKKSTTGISSLWFVFACKGKSVKFLKWPTERKLSTHWTRDKNQAGLFRNKSFAQKAARRYSHTAWQIGSAGFNTTKAQIIAACSKA